MTLINKCTETKKKKWNIEKQKWVMLKTSSKKYKSKGGLYQVYAKIRIKLELQIQQN